VALALPVIACSVACSAGGAGSKATTSTFAGQGGASSGSGLGGDQGNSSSSGLGGLGLTGPAGSTGAGGDAGRASRCDDAGNCSCINIASIGHEGVWGPCSSDSTTALQNWLNTQSTAKVDNYDTTKPTLTPAFLAQYDVLILQWMVENGKQNDDGAAWVFSPAEISALEAWTKAGGGIIALSGYQCNGQGCTIYDTAAPNQLLSFTDISYNNDDVLDDTGSDYYCWGGAVPLGGPVQVPAGGDAGPISPSVAPSFGSWDQSSPIGAHINDVGAYIGRSINSTTATVDNTDGTHKYAVHEQVGQGHVFVFGDEWVTYSGEWLGTASCISPSMFTSPYDPCYEKSAAQVFQLPQFWYNAIKYASSSVQCFNIMNPTIIQ